MKSNPEQQLLSEIEAARARHAWAKAETKRAGSTPALARFVAESLAEWRALKAKLDGETRDHGPE